MTEVTELVPVGEAIEAITRGEIDMQISTAKKWPRPALSAIRDKVLSLATADEETAASCIYAIPRGGKVIKGPGTRFAEILAASYGNLRVGGRVIGIDDKHVTVQGACHDLENNYAASADVKRRITDRNGRRFSDDMIAVTANAAMAIAMRNAVFKVIPRGLFTEILNEIEAVGMGDARTLAATRNAAIVYINGLGVETPRILAVLDKPKVEDLEMEDVATLRGVVTAIKEGTTTADEAFPKPKGAGSKLAAGRHKATKPKAKPKPAKAPTAAPRAKTTAPGLGRENAIKFVDAYMEQAVDLSAFDDHLDRLKLTRENWDSASDEVLDKLCSAVTDLQAAEG